MKPTDIIMKKRMGKALSAFEIQEFVRGACDGSFADYQLSAMLMAICIRGMGDGETLALTHAMAQSGEQMDLGHLPGVKADKHSSGGVGDKTTLICMPIVAALGLTVAKMSGRGLGFTGGTVDKLEAIPGFETALSSAAFDRVVKQTRMCLAGQSGDLAPADKTLYALRDVTGTVMSMPLIASSIMSKKLASGADVLVLDVKCGAGAFMKSEQDAKTLAQTMVNIAKGAGRKAAALISDMDAPLGYAIGNALEVIEALETLNGRGPNDLTQLSLTLAAQMLTLATGESMASALKRAKRALNDGSALNAFRETVKAQGGDISYVDDPSRFALSTKTTVLAPQTGYIAGMDAEKCGHASMLCGAGRMAKEDLIDHGAGIVLKNKVGDFATEGQPIAALYTKLNPAPAQQAFLNALTFSPTAPKARPLILGKVE